VRWRRLALGLLVSLAWVAVVAPPAAAFPGSNGRIAFLGDRYGGTHNIFTMDPDGSNVRRLTSLTAERGAALRPSWSADGTMLVFEQRNADGSVRQIHAMNGDGSGKHLVFKDPDFRDFAPAFSPDGKRIVFQRCRSDFEACGIASVQTDGQGLMAITRINAFRNIFDGKPRYSPDGSMVVFDSFNRGGVIAAIYVIPSTGGSVRRITPTALEAITPGWSPDGTKVVFAANCCLPRMKAIWMVRVDGTRLHRLTSPGHKIDFAPQFSPDGKRIVFERDSPDFSTFKAVAMNRDGSHVSTIQPDASEPDWGPAP